MWDKSKKCLLHKHLFIFYLHNSLLAFKAWTLQQLFQQSGAIIPNEKLKNGSLTMTAKLVLPKPEPLPLAKKSQISEQHLQVWLMADNWLELWLNWVTPYKLINNLCFRTYCAILSIFALAPCILEAPLLPMMGWRLRLSAAAQRMCFPLLRTSHTATALPLLYSHTHIFLPWKQQLSLCYSFTSPYIRDSWAYFLHGINGLILIDHAAHATLAILSVSWPQKESTFGPAPRRAS